MSAADLIVKMLAVNPSDRLSFHDVLHHPWLTVPEAAGAGAGVEAGAAAAPAREASSKLAAESKFDDDDDNDDDDDDDDVLARTEVEM